jgi:hypothetical protein
MGVKRPVHHPSVVSTSTEMPERETFRKLGSTGYITLIDFGSPMQVLSAGS